MNSFHSDDATSLSDHEHVVWDELAAGAALHALEPDEQQLFDLHLEDCDLCRSTLADAELVAAQLGSLSVGEDATVPDWAAMGPRILGGITSTPQTRTGGDELAAARQRRVARLTTSRRLLAAAAAVVVLAGGAVLAVRATGGSGSTSTTAGMCHAVVGCHAVELQTSSGVTMADVIVKGNRATIVPKSIQRAPKGKTYVLWQVAAAKPTPVGEFDASGTTSTSLELPYASTLVFAVSEENRGSLPSMPTRVLASSPAS